VQSLHPPDLAQGEAIKDPSAEENIPSRLADGSDAMETRTEDPQFESSFRRPPLIRRYK